MLALALQYLLLFLLNPELSTAGYFDDDLNYIAKVYPDAVEEYCPNLPYYGGLLGVAGEYAHKSPLNIIHDSYEVVEIKDSAEQLEKNKPFFASIDNKITQPVILLWTHRISNRIGYINECPNSQCVITENRNWLNHSLTKAVYFYGTMMKLTDLPLPRPEGQLWVLQHEESPKNNPVFSYKSIMELFNVTSTFRQESHFPLTTQYLRNVEQLENKTYTKTFREKNRYQSKEGLAPIIYVQSDCDTPSDRDRIVQWMMKYIKIDSYGKCLNNKKLPSHLQNPMAGMDHKDFIDLVSKYKFAIAMENGICNDYITEKFWRPLIVGTIPITLGAPNIKEFAPTNKSIIDIRDYQTIKSLIHKIKSLDKDEEDYEAYRTFKQSKITNEKLRNILTNRKWEPDFDAMGMNLDGKKGNMINHFDCYLCDIIHDREERKDTRARATDFRVNKNHYGCPLPMEYTTENNLTLQRPYSDLWYSSWMLAYCEMKAMLELSEGGRKYYTEHAYKAASKMCMQGGHWKRKTLD